MKKFQFKVYQWFLLLSLFSTLQVFAETKEGFYAGVGVGGAFDRFHLFTKSLDTGLSVHNHKRKSETVGEAFVGYGYTSCNNFFIAGELSTVFPRRTLSLHRAAVAFLDFTFTNKIQIQEYVLVDVLPGYRINCRSLIYGRIGFSYSQFKLEQPANIAAASTSFHHSKNKYGFTLGLGTTYSITEHIGIGLDYRYTFYDSSKTHWDKYNLDFKPKVNTQYLGVSLIYSL